MVNVRCEVGVQDHFLVLPILFELSLSDLCANGSFQSDGQNFGEI